YDPFMAQPIVEHRKSHSRIARARSTQLVVTKLKCRVFRHLEKSLPVRRGLSRPRPALSIKGRRDGVGGGSKVAREAAMRDFPAGQPAEITEHAGIGTLDRSPAFRSVGRTRLHQGKRRGDTYSLRRQL